MLFFTVFNEKIVKFSTLFQNYFLFVLFFLYTLSVVFPAPGIFLNELSFGHLSMSSNHTFSITTPMVFLSIILFNASLCISNKDLKKIHKYFYLILAGVAGNFFLGFVIAALFRVPLSLFVSPDNVQQMLIAIAILTAVPIAGTATAWTQTVKGNLTLTLGMLLATTMMCPVLTPLIFHAFTLFAHGEYVDKLQYMANHGANTFLIFVVVTPAVIGIISHFIIGEANIRRANHLIKVTNQLCLSLLCYSNASAVLPQKILHNPNIKILALYFVVAVIFCFLTYFTGWVISKTFNTTMRDEMSLMFSEGMKNVGTALVLARFGFAEYANVSLLIIFFAIAQQFIASTIKGFEYSRLLKKKKSPERIEYLLQAR